MEDSSGLAEKFKRYKYTELGKEESRWEKTSIYRVPAHIKNMKYSSAYRPQWVSLGPFHHRDTDLGPTEGHKHRALLHLVKRADKPMDEFVAAVEEEADQLEAAYGEDLDQKWRGDNNREHFVEMMVTDGCFLLEAMRMAELKGEVPDYESDDPVFSKHGYRNLKNVIIADMFVMENQLPMLLLETLARLVPSERSQDVGDMVQNMVVAFFGLPVDNSRLLCRRIYLPVRGLHPIDIACKILCGESESYDEEWGERKDTMPSALELYEAGIHFKASSSRSILDIDFQRGVLSMPVLRVHNYVGTVFLNLMAFEQVRPGAGNGVTEYLIFMDHIIDSAKDVALSEIRRGRGLCVGLRQRGGRAVQHSVQGSDGSFQEAPRSATRRERLLQKAVEQVAGQPRTHPLHGPLGVHLPRGRRRPARSHPPPDLLHYQAGLPEPALN